MLQKAVILIAKQSIVPNVITIHAMMPVCLPKESTTPVTYNKLSVITVPIIPIKK